MLSWGVTEDTLLLMDVSSICAGIETKVCVQCLFLRLSPSLSVLMQIPPASSPHTSKWDMTEEEVMRPCSGMKKAEEAREDRTITLLTYRTSSVMSLCTVHCKPVGRQCTWLEFSSSKTCFVCWVVRYFFFFFYQHDILNGCFASSICLLQDHCNLLMWKKISPAHGLMPAFFWRRAALWQTHSLWLLSGTPFLACTLSVLLTPGHWG